MDFEKSVATLVAAAESVIDHCLLPVQAAPLIAMDDAVHGMQSVETANDDHPIWDLIEACEDVEWSRWRDNGRAIVNTHQAQELAKALAEYRKAMAEASHGVLRD